MIISERDIAVRLKKLRARLKNLQSQLEFLTDDKSVEDINQRCAKLRHAIRIEVNNRTRIKQQKTHQYLHIYTGEPVRPGVYVVYIRERVSSTPYLKTMFLTWDGQTWYHCGSSQRYRRKVYGWIGPIPAYVLDDKNYTY